MSTGRVVARGAVQPTWHMVTVEAGFELWRGGVGLTSHGFSFTDQPKLCG